MNLSAFARSNNVVDHRPQGQTPSNGALTRSRSIGGALRGRPGLTGFGSADTTPRGGRVQFPGMLTPPQEGNRIPVVGAQPTPFSGNKFGLAAPGQSAMPSWMPAISQWLPNWMFPE
jgi:hypothetical protein